MRRFERAALGPASAPRTKADGAPLQDLRERFRHAARRRRCAAPWGSSMLKIYGQYRSRAFRVVWLCKESRIPYEHVNVTVGGAAPGCKEDWYRRLNPNARVPAIDDDGFVMWESAAINVYLAQKYRSPLYPEDAQGVGRALQWAFFATNDIEPPMITLYQHRVVLPGHERNPALADDCERRLLDKLAVVEGQLARTPYVGGKRWNLSDFMVASVLYTLHTMKPDLSRLPRLETWLEESVERPAAREARKLRE
jgi:glutathione S-transferase